eukprot:jgi/Mesen1/8673/ME000508S08053
MTDNQEQTFSGAEIEFLAEDGLISIVPNFRMEKLGLICGEFGPFFPQLPVEVPLWLALALKKRRKCAIQTPEWMKIDELTRVLELERESSREFQPLPFHYMEIAELLFESESHGLNIQDKYQVRTLLKDIRDVRFHKIESGLQFLEGRRNAIKLTNLSAMEVNIVRPFFVKSLQFFQKHDKEEGEGSQATARS